MDRLQDLQNQPVSDQPVATPDTGGGDKRRNSRKKSTDQKPPAPVQDTLKMESFFRRRNDVLEDIKRIQSIQKELERLHRQSSQEVNPAKLSELSASIEAASTLATKYASHARQVIKDIDLENEEVRPLSHGQASAMRGREQNTTVLKRDYKRAMEGFNKMQGKAQRDYQDALERQYRIVKPGATAEEIRQIVEDQNGARERIFSMSVAQKYAQQKEEMQKRATDMRKLERSIVELAALFQDMEFNVTSQQDLLNRISKGVEDIEEETGAAAKDMQQAVRDAKALQKQKIIIIAVVSIIILIILIVIIVQVAKVYWQVRGPVVINKIQPPPQAPPANPPAPKP